MSKKSRIKNDPEWRGILNIAGFALILTMWPALVDRVCEFRVVPEASVRIISDINAALLVFATLIATALAAFAEHDKTKHQVAWIQRSIWPFWLGWVLALIYLLSISLSSPAWPLEIIKLR